MDKLPRIYSDNNWIVSVTYGTTLHRHPEQSQISPPPLKNEVLKNSRYQGETQVKNTRIDWKFWVDLYDEKTISSNEHLIVWHDI